MFDHSKLWLDVGYTVDNGVLEDGHEVVLARTPDTSPPFLENHSEVGDLIHFVRFENKEQQSEWLANSIQLNLDEEELDPDDIIVINPDPRSTRKEVGQPRKILFERGIDSHLVGVDMSPDVFFDQQRKSVAFTGIFRAKGNEAGMVYIMNADRCAGSFGNLTRVRNQLFTAITRSKSWVRVLGVGARMEELMEEFDAVRRTDFKLQFVYPTEDMRRTMNIVNRDMTEVEKAATKDSTKQLNKLIDDVETGRVLIDDLPDETLERLRTIIGGGSRNE